MDWDPPCGMGQLTECAAIASTSPIAAVVRCVNGKIECAANPAHNPFASLVSNLLDMLLADSRAFKPNPAKAYGCLGKCKGASTSFSIIGQFFSMGPIIFKYACSSLPSSWAVSLMDCVRTAAVPSSNGCATATGGAINSRPNFLSGIVLKKGDAAAIG